MTPYALVTEIETLVREHDRQIRSSPGFDEKRGTVRLLLVVEGDVAPRYVFPIEVLLVSSLSPLGCETIVVVC